ncbi:DUF1488 family protein [Brucella intermedia]|uniref:DUF1488 family protein n=1 Tax=Brucella intermedia TaxID=94625 RepID=UPI002362B05E|nr:DUF1488 family protein [Brucella intermedia]
MALSFPNPSRSFDDFEVGVRFVGYDGMTSVPFLIDKPALEKNGAIAAAESSLLAAFDASRKTDLRCCSRGLLTGPANFLSHHRGGHEVASYAMIEPICCRNSASVALLKYKAHGACLDSF